MVVWHDDHMHSHAGYAFLLFKLESSVHKLLFSCKAEGEKLIFYILPKKKVFFRDGNIHVCDLHDT
jgi:hypothetical protein